MIIATQALEKQLKKGSPLDPEKSKETNRTTTGDVLLGIPKEGNKMGKAEDEVKKTKPILITNSRIPKVDVDCENKLWEVVKQNQPWAHTILKPPLEEIDFDQKMLELEIRSEYRDVDSKKSKN